MNRNIIEELCVMHGFKWDTIGKFLRITSKRGTYYILDINHEGRKIKLYHQNLYSHAGFHKHGEHLNLYNVFLSIQKHDNIYNVGSRNNKLTRMTDLFKQLHTSA